jgi:hypothetical protein
MTARVEIQHERWMGDRWKVMFRIGRQRFHIGAECNCAEVAERLRDDFEKAIASIGVTVPNAEGDSLPPGKENHGH